MMEESLPDIETAGGGAVVRQQQQPAQHARFSRKFAIATGIVALGALVVIGAVIMTRQPDGGVSVQAVSQHLHQDSPNFGTVAASVGTAVEECEIGGPCSQEGANCAIGRESCCGETFNSIECECSGGEWMCLNTDACMRPDCGDLPSCDDSSSGKFCASNDDCTCGNVCLDSVFDDFSVCGCEVNTTNGCDPNSNKPFCYEAYSVTGVDCGCRNDDDCEGDETCGTSWCVANIVPFCSVDHNLLCPPTQSPVSSFVPPQTFPPTIVNVITEDPTPAPTPEPTEVGTSEGRFDTLAPTDAATRPPTPEPTDIVTSPPTDVPTDIVTPQPTPEPTSEPTPEPTEIVTSPPTPKPTPLPTVVATAGETTLAVPLTYEPTPSPTDEDNGSPGTSSSCVNIKFTSSKDYPKDNGFTFLSTKSGEVIGKEKAGFMTEPQTEYLRQFCNLSLGSYTLVVTDTGKDGMYADGQGSYIVDIDGQVVLVGGRFRTEEISHEILVGFNTIMSETEQEFLDVHNSRRQDFHESQDVSFRPMAWSAELAAGASAWAREKAKTCSTDGLEKGRYGQNASNQRIARLDLARPPERIVNSWFNNFDPEQSVWNNNLKAGTAVLWRTALYVGCATEIGPIENCTETELCLCQVTNCRYSRTTNCAVQQNNWIASVIDENGQLCNSVFCPGADENGNIVEGACHV